VSNEIMVVDARLRDAGQKSGAWQKMRVNHGQEFVIGGYATRWWRVCG
jgi:hypothetical protein